MSFGPKHYRFYDTIGPEGVTIECQRYVVIGETPRYWYVVKEYMLAYSEQSQKQDRKRVAKEISYGGRSLCYQDKTAAMRSYHQRKIAQFKHAKIALARADAAIVHCELLVTNPELISDTPQICAGGNYIKELGWGDY